MPNFNCKHCGKEHYSKHTRTKYCSKACFGLSNRIRTILDNCAQCNKPLVKGQYRFCCKSCTASYNNTGSSKPQAVKDKISKSLTIYTPDEALTAHNARSAKRRANKLNQTPPWFDEEAVKQFYINCPKGYHVDHIYPLNKGGLHSLENLQYLEASENIAKKDRTPIEWREYKLRRFSQSMVRIHLIPPI